MIKEISLLDYEQLHDLELEIFNLHFTNRPNIFNSTNPLPYEEFESMIKDKSYLIYGYYDNGKLIGAVYIHENNYQNILIKPQKSYFIEDLVIRSDYQNKGIGSKLMEFIEQKAHENNIFSIELSVWSFNVDAIAFYEKMGYSCKNLRYEKNLNDNYKINITTIKINTTDGLE